MVAARRQSVYMLEFAGLLTGLPLMPNSGRYVSHFYVLIYIVNDCRAALFGALPLVSGCAPIASAHSYYSDWVVAALVAHETLI
jgi:hypothetical protein